MSRHIIDRYNVREFCKNELIIRVGHIYARNCRVSHVASKIRKLKKMTPTYLRAWLVNNCPKGYYDGHQPSGAIAGWKKYRGVDIWID